MNGITSIKMEYVDFGLIKAMINKGKTVEQFLGLTKNSEYSTIKWISLYYDRDEYCIDFHEVFDEREEGLDNIYDFSYVEPDNMYGKRLYQSSDFEKLIEWIFENIEISRDRFMPFDYLNNELTKEK